MLKFIDRAVVAYYNKRTREHLPVITGDDLATKADEFAEDTLKKISGRYGGNAHFQTRESAKTFFKKHFYDAVRGSYDVIEPARKTPVVIASQLCDVFSFVNARRPRPTVTAAELDYKAAIFVSQFLQQIPDQEISYDYFKNDDSIETAQKKCYYDLIRDRCDVIEVVEEASLHAPSPS